MLAKANYTDDVLLKLMSQGDQEAFTLLYRRYWEGLFVTAAKVLREQEAAKDVIQDVFFTLWKRRKELRVKISLAAYLQTSIRYKAIHYIEKNITRRHFVAMLSDFTVNDLRPSADGNLRLKEVQQAIQVVVEKMPPKMREVYLLSRDQHLSHKQIADKLEISIETVKKHIQHALQLIKEAVGYNKVQC